MVSNITGINRHAWHSIWKLNDVVDDLGKSIHAVRDLLQPHMRPEQFKALMFAINRDYDIPHFWDSMSPNQSVSKTWLKEELSKVSEFKQGGKLKDGTYPVGKKRIQLVGGWFGFPLTNILLDIFKGDLDFIENIDLDENAISVFHQIANEKKLDKDVRLIGTCANFLDNNLRSNSIDVLINTSSEHMPPLPQLFKDKNPKPTCLYVLQSNNMTHLEEHVNCVNSEDELVETSEITEVVYKGSMMMTNGYKRFMVIGYQ